MYSQMIYFKADTSPTSPRNKNIFVSKCSAADRRRMLRVAFRSGA
jgi:hypothetical protein